MRKGQMVMDEMLESNGMHPNGVSGCVVRERWVLLGFKETFPPLIVPTVASLAISDSERICSINRSYFLWDVQMDKVIIAAHVHCG